MFVDKSFTFPGFFPDQLTEHKFSVSPAWFLAKIFLVCRTPQG